MPHTSSASKRLRQNIKRRDRNRDAKKGIRLQLKKIARLPKDETAEGVTKEIQAAVRKLDKAAARKVLHPNTAARKKSQLQKLLNQKLAAPAAPAAPPAKAK